ncbi:MAG TPA: hypothetical protein VNB86_01720 [Gaiellaceae bacterium]|jgi:hypothetical protein|nr:hypothetical protein [Gaiellaceae bacterium]
MPRKLVRSAVASGEKGIGLTRDRVRPSAGRLAAITAAVLISAAAFLGFGASPAAARTPCWERVMNDWVVDSRLDRAYSLACLESALDHAPEDVLAYSDFEEQIGAARQRMLREPQAARQLRADASQAPGEGARTIPVPLIVLSVFAAALLLAGGADLGARKLGKLRGPRRPS